MPRPVSKNRFGARGWFAADAESTEPGSLAPRDPFVDYFLVESPDPSDTNGRDLTGLGQFADCDLMQSQILRQFSGGHDLCQNGSPVSSLISSFSQRSSHVKEGMRELISRNPALHLYQPLLYRARARGLGFEGADVTPALAGPDSSCIRI